MERKIGQLLEFFSYSLEANVNKAGNDTLCLSTDQINNIFSSTQLKVIRNKIGIISNFSKYKKHKTENGKNKLKNT